MRPAHDYSGRPHLTGRGVAVHPHPMSLPPQETPNQMQKIQKTSPDTQDTILCYPLDINRLGALQGSHNLESVVRWTAMTPPYSQAQLLFISSLLKASEPFIDFRIKTSYLPLHSKVEKTEVQAASGSYLVALPMRHCS